MDRQTQLLAIRGKASRHIDGGALLDVLEDLLIARFVADNQQTAPGILHCLQRVVICRDTRSAAPGKVQLLQLGAEFNRTRLLIVEGIVVEEYLLETREIL